MWAFLSSSFISLNLGHLATDLVGLPALFTCASPQRLHPSFVPTLFTLTFFLHLQYFLICLHFSHFSASCFFFSSFVNSSNLDSSLMNSRKSLLTSGELSTTFRC